MNLVKLDNNIVHLFKKSVEDILEKNPEMKDFIIICINKENGIQMRRSNNSLPLLTAMNYFQNDILNKDLIVSNYTFEKDNFIEKESDE